MRRQRGLVGLMGLAALVGMGFITKPAEALLGDVFAGMAQKALALHQRARGIIGKPPVA